MSVLKPIFRFELKKSIKKWKIVVFVITALVLQLFLQVGYVVYKEALESKIIFQDLEHKKASRYIHYGQYGSFGIWLKFVPHSNSILFYDSTVNNFYCNADCTYVSNAYIPFKGRQLFTDNSHYLNFWILFFFIYSFVSLVYGLDMIVRKDYFKFITFSNGLGKVFWLTVLSRISVLILSAVILFFISLLPVLIFNGINLLGTSLPTFLGIILSIFFFFSLGSVIGFVNSKFARGLVFATTYLFLIILLPWLLNLYVQMSAKEIQPLIEYDNRNFEILMQQEDEQVKEHGDVNPDSIPKSDAIRDYKNKMEKMKNIFKRNENKYKSLSIKKISQKQTISSFIPSLFYFSLCESNSSLGLLSVIDFHSYCQKQKEKFTDFISMNAFPIGNKQVKSFFKGDEDLFYSKPKLPYNFILGIILTFIYSTLVLGISYRMHARRLKINKPHSTYSLPNNQETSIQILCKNHEVQDDLLNYFLEKNNATCITKINTEDFHFNGVTPAELLDHLCILSRVDKSIAERNLNTMGIRDIKGFKKLNRELTLKIIVAIKTAVDSEIIVLSDFFKQESREFEGDVFDLLMAFEAEGRKIIYLSTEPFQISSSLTEEFNIEKIAILPADLKEISYR